MTTAIGFGRNQSAEEGNGVGPPCLNHRMNKVVIGALVAEGQVLLAHRRDDKHAYPGEWDLPGGVVESGESDLDALARELHEELGVRVGTTSALYLDQVTVGPEHEPVIIRAWLIRDWTGVPSNVAPEEHQAIAWFHADELPKLSHPPIQVALERELR